MEANLEAVETVADLAAQVGLSPRRLESLFQQSLGTSPGAYRLSLRLAAAHRMLTDTSHPLAEIALRTGFSGAPALARAFRAKHGVTPSSLRVSRA